MVWILTKFIGEVFINFCPDCWFKYCLENYLNVTKIMSLKFTLKLASNFLKNLASILLQINLKYGLKYTLNIRLNQSTKNEPQRQPQLALKLLQNHPKTLLKKNPTPFHHCIHSKSKKIARGKQMTFCW